jgi:hypothetical protein
MCPIFHATHAEAATPRAKANLLRHILHEDPRQLSADAVREVRLALGVPPLRTGPVAGVGRHVVS